MSRIKAFRRDKRLVKILLLDMAKKIGTVTHVFGKIDVAILQLDSELKIGDAIQFKGKHTDFAQTIDSMQVNHEQIQKAKKGDDVGVKTTQPAQVGDDVFLAE